MRYYYCPKHRKLLDGAMIQEWLHECDEPKIEVKNEAEIKQVQKLYKARNKVRGRKY